MNLILRHLAVIGAFSMALVSELQQMVERLNDWGKQEHNADGTHNEITVNAITFNGDTQTTVGAAGGASALPATPSGYIVLMIGTTEYIIPYYAKS
jgi:hypothetical protein